MLAILRRRNFALPIGAQMFGNFAYMGGFILAPSLLQRVFGYGESTIGFMVLSRPLAFSLTAPVAGYLAVRMGERIAAVLGATAVVGSMVVFAAINRQSSMVVVIAALALSGIGLGMAQPSVSASVANSVEEGSLGIASASQQLMTQVGVVAGIQLMQTIQTSDEGHSGLVGSFASAYRWGAVVAVLGVVCAAGLRRSERSPSDDG